MEVQPITAFPRCRWLPYHARRRARPWTAGHDDDRAAAV